MCKFAKANYSGHFLMDNLAFLFRNGKNYLLWQRKFTIVKK